MKLFLTSHIGGMKKADGKKIPAPLSADNGFVDMLKEAITENAKVLMIPGSPDDHEKNDSVCICLKQAFPMSGINISSAEVCDDRNTALADHINEMDVILLCGGHVPTQNAFFKLIGLKEKLADYNGVVIGYSAGSMNCADNVYAGPEFEGEAIDPDYKRWLKGLGLTDINIFPHFQLLRNEWLDGMRIVEDITFADSMGHRIIAINDGTYIAVNDGRAVLYGEAYEIKDGRMKQICGYGKSMELKS